MAKKLEFEATMDVADIVKGYRELEKRARESEKVMKRLADKQSEHAQKSLEASQKASEKRNQANIEKHYAERARARAKEAADYIRQNGKDKSLRDEVADYRNQKAWNIADAQYSEKQARAMNAAARESDALAKAEARQASEAGKLLDQEINKYNELTEAIKRGKEALISTMQQQSQEYLASQQSQPDQVDERKNAIVESLKSMIVGFGNGMSNVLEGVGNGAVKAGSALLGTLSNGLKKVGSLAMGAARSGLQAIWGGLQKVASMAVNAAKSLGGALINGLKSIGAAALNAGKSLLGFNKRHKSFSSGLKGGFMMILKYAFGIRSLYFLFRRLRTALTDSIKTFAQHDAETASSIQGISASLNTLKASFGAAFAPVINAVAPILIRLIDLCTKAANAVGALIAALTGGKTFKVAAAGADSLAKSTGGASKEAKELKKQLAGFDELEILSEDKDSDSGSGSGSGAVSYEDMELPDWAKKIKEMIDNAQWEDLADLLTAKLNDLVNSVDWAGIGDTIGYWMNAALTFLARAITGFDWYNLGAKLAEMLNHVMYEVNWENLGKILVSRLYIMLQSVSGFLRNFDWDYFTRSLYDVIRGAVLGIDWVQVASDFIDGLADMFGGIADGLDNIEWSDFGNELTKGYQRAIEDIDWEDLGNSISDFLHSALTSATELVTSIEPTVMAENFRVFLSGVFGSIDWVKLMEDFLGFITTMLDNASSFITSLGFGQMAQGLSELISNALSSTSWGELASSFSNFLHTMITNAVTFLKNLDVKSMGESFVTFFKNIFDGIDFVQLANDIKDLIINACEKATELIKTVGDSGGGYRKMGSDLWDWFSETFKQIDWASLAESIFTFLGTAIGAAAGIVWQFIHDAVTKIFDYFRDIAKSKDEDGHLTGKEILEGILEGISEAVTGIGGWIKEHIWTPFWEGLKETFGINSPAKTMIEPGQMIGEGVLEGISKVFEAIGDWIKEHIFDPIVNGAKEGINAIRDAFSGVGETVAGAIDTGKQWISTAWDGITGIFKDNKPDVYPTEEALLFKQASDELNATLQNSQTSSMSAQEAYDMLSATVESLKGKTNLTTEEMNLLLQSEQMLTDLTQQYGNELERQGRVVDSNAKSVQNAAKAVGDEANAVTTASKETQNLNQAVNESNEAYQNASTQANQYGSDMEVASSKSESSANRVDTSAKKIETSMTESASKTAENVRASWNEIESSTFAFSDSMEEAISGIIQVMDTFANRLTVVLAQCVSSVVEACTQMARAWNTDWGTPHFHMPVFSMSGVFDLKTGQTPQVYISGWQWMARGGIVDGATLIGAGEDGKEAIVPLERNTEWIDMVAEGLIDRISTSKYASRLAEAFASAPLPAMVGGSIVPPNSLVGASGGSLGETLMEELRSLRDELSALASQPIELSTSVEIDRREVGKAVTQFQRSEARSRG